MIKAKTAFASLFICLGLFSTGYGQTNKIELVGKLPLTGLPVHDVWGYIDSATGNSYALLCASTSGLRIIDVTIPSNPVLTGSISGNGVQAIDVKTWKNYAYTVAESGSVSGKIIDLSDPGKPVKAGTFPAGHNIYISESGYLYLAAPGLRIFDLNTDPTKPSLVYSDNSCNGHDISIKGQTLYDFSDNCGTRIYDISRPDTVILKGMVPPSGMFHHSGWPTEDGKYILICDELALPSENDITVWDISNLSAPFLADSFIDANAYVHNLYVLGNYGFVSYYRAGFRVFDVSDPTNFTLLAEYDTDSALSGPGYGGNFGLYTFWGNDMILASDEDNGLYIFKFSGLGTGINSARSDDLNDLVLYPNPVKDQSLLKYNVESNGLNVRIEIWSIDGRRIKSVDEGIKAQGINQYILSTDGLETGNYIIKIRSGRTEKTIKLLVVD